MVHYSNAYKKEAEIKVVKSYYVHVTAQAANQSLNHCRRKRKKKAIHLHFTYFESIGIH